MIFNDVERMSSFNNKCSKLIVQVDFSGFRRCAEGYDLLDTRFARAFACLIHSMKQLIFYSMMRSCCLLLMILWRALSAWLVTSCCHHCHLLAEIMVQKSVLLRHSETKLIAFSYFLGYCWSSLCSPKLVTFCFQNVTLKMMPCSSFARGLTRHKPIPSGRT